MHTIQTFHPSLIVNDHFQEIINQIDINTESLLDNKALKADGITELNTLRDTQITKIKEIHEINVKRLPVFNEDEYVKTWSYVFNDSKLDYYQKLEIIKESLISLDCVLIEDFSLANNLSLWIMPCFYNKQDLEFLKFYKSHSTNSKESILNKPNVRSIVFCNQSKNQLNNEVIDYRNSSLNDVKDFSVKKEKKEKDFCYFFQVTWIDRQAFNTFPNIQILDLSKSKLTSSGIMSGTFQGLINLKQLNLSTNQIEFISADMFQGLQNLEELILYRNKLCRLESLTFGNLKNLKILNLENNLIVNIDSSSFYDLDYLEELSLYKNKLSNIQPLTFGKLKSLKKLNLKNNQIFLDSSSFDGLVKLEELNLEYNKASNLVPKLFLSLKSLKKLYLDWNLIGDGSLNTDSFRGLENLEELHLCKNILTKISSNTFKCLTKLKRLNLGFNQICQLEASSFLGLENLYELNIEYNFLENINSETFAYLNLLKVLHLNGNSISIDCKIDPKPDFYTAFLKNNPGCLINV